MSKAVRWLSYEFYVCEIKEKWKDVGGVYIFTGVKQGKWVPLYIGQTGSFRERIALHEQWDQAVPLGATHVHAKAIPSEADFDSELAQELGIPRVLVPTRPGILSAFGVAIADIVKDYSRTVMLRGSDVNRARLEDEFDGMEGLAREELRREGLPGDYLYGDHREPYRQGGLWGIFRVFAKDDATASIQPLPVSP